MNHTSKINELWSEALKVNHDDIIVRRFYRSKLNSKLASELENYVEKLFDKCDQNIYDLHLTLVEQSHEFKRNPSCGLFITEIFSNWLRMSQYEKRKLKLEHMLEMCTRNSEGICYCVFDTSTLHRAFELAIKHNLALLSVFKRLYDFSANGHLIDVILNEKILKLNYVDKATLLGDLCLQHKYFNTEELILPLLLQNQYAAIESYINKNEECFIKVMEICNRLCDMNFHLKDFSKNFDHVPNKKLEKFKAKVIAKFAIAYMKKMNKLSLIDTFEHIRTQAKLSQLRFLVYLKYDKSQGNDDISEDSWMELISDLIHNDELLHLQLLIELMCYQRDLHAVEKFIKQLNLYDLIEKLPTSVKKVYKELLANQSSTGRQLSETNATKDVYDTDELTLENIVFVDNDDKFELFLNDIETNKRTSARIVGLDCEWKPFYGTLDQDSLLSETQSPNRVSTLQVSTRLTSYIFDMTFYMSCLSDEKIEKFGKVFLLNPEIIKLGYAFSQDTTRLQNSLPKLKDRFQNFAQSVVSIDGMVSEFQQLFDQRLFDSNTSRDKTISKGLSELVRLCFGRALNKSERMSNWDRRPLRNEQLKYAALDAFVLIKIFDFVKQRCQELNLDFGYFCIPE